MAKLLTLHAPETHATALKVVISNPWILIAVVVLGGAYAGVQVAHRLLKYTKPHVKDLKVILVSKVR